MKNTSKFIYQVVITAGIVIFIFMLFLTIWGEHALKDERTYTDYSVMDYSDGWSRVNATGEQEPIELPGHFELSGEGQLIIKKTIEHLDRPVQYISFDSEKQDVYVYVNDKLRYNYSTYETRLFGNNSPGAFMFVPIYADDEGAELTIIFSGDNNYSGMVDKINIGTQAGLIIGIFEGEKHSLFAAILLMVLGFVAFIIGTLVKLSYGKTLPLFFAGWGVMCAGIWALAESPTRQFIAPNFSLISYITYLSLMILPVVMALYFDRLSDGRYRTFYLITSVLELFVAYLGMTLQLVNQTDLSGVLVYAFWGIILTMVIFIITLVADFIQGYAKKIWPELVGIFGAMAAGVVQMISYRDHPTYMDRDIILAGLLFLIIMSYIRAFQNVRNMERDMYAAVQAQEASSAFLTRMSHEMRTPINAILGMNKMILREAKDDTILDYARDVNSAGNYLLGIVNEVLDLAKVNAGRVELENETYNLMDLVRECYAMVRPRAKASRLAFEVDMNDVLPSELAGDRERLIQIVTNLLTNAVKYTPEGRITLSVNGKISDGKLLLNFAVSDTGVGIEKESIPYLFDSFRRVGEFNNNRIEGTGLGLTITKQLVDLMGGTITVDSTVGKGSTFTVIIPQDIRSIEPCGAFSMGPNGDRRVYDRHEVFDLLGRILVVDDVAINLRVFSMLLNNTDVTVDTAISGIEALEKIKSTKYDIIFIDHLMPGMDGLELKTIMDSLENNPNRDTPLVMQTANTVLGAKEEYERLGFSDYIEKPIKEEELKRLLRKYII